MALKKYKTYFTKYKETTINLLCQSCTLCPGVEHGFYCTEIIDVAQHPAVRDSTFEAPLSCEMISLYESPARRQTNPPFNIPVPSPVQVNHHQ